jgi:hypothetical protein
MSTSSAPLPARAITDRQRKPALAHARAYFASDGTRTVQTVLGLIWLLDGGLQFQSFMYGKGFLAVLTVNAPGQPGWLFSSIHWGARLAGHNLTVYDTLFGLIQVAIGLGLLYRRSVKAALALSFAWALVVWWFGEGFGMLFMNMASPLTGAPGGVILYAMIGLIVWPGRPGGLLGVRGARTMWAGLWLLMAWLWLEAPSSSANAISNAIKLAPSGMSWLSSLQLSVAGWTKGDGLVLALICAALSAAIGIAVAANWRPKPFLVAAVILNLALWVLSQGFGGIFAGDATDPNAGLLFIVLAFTLYTLVGQPQTGSPAASLRVAQTGASVAG